MTDIFKTNWDNVLKASISTCHDPGKREVNEALIEILKQFEKQIYKYFIRRLRSFPHLDAEEMLAEFWSYIIEYRKKIFRKADPNEGKLRNYIYSIAWSFANRYIAKTLKHPQEVSEFYGAQKNNSIQEELEIKEELEYVKIINNLVFMKLKEDDRSKYDLLKYRFFQKTEPSIREIAIHFGLIDKNEKNQQKIKTVENTMSKKLARAKEKFIFLFEQEIETSLEALKDNSEEKKWIIEERKKLCQNYFTKKG